MKTLKSFLLLVVFFLGCFVAATLALEDDPTAPLLTPSKDTGTLLGAVPTMLTCSYLAFVFYAFTHNREYDGYSGALPAIMIIGLYSTHSDMRTFSRETVDNFCQIFAALSILYIAPAYLFTGMINFDNTMDNKILWWIRACYYGLLTLTFKHRWVAMRSHIFGDGLEKGYAMTKLGQISDKLDLFNKIMLLPGAFMTTYNAFTKDPVKED